MLLSLQGELRYKQLNNECLVYNLATAETLLLEKRAASILKTIPYESISVKQLKARIDTSDDSSSECLTLEEVLGYLVNAGLVKKTA